jgi:hypothetical protein
MTFDDFPLYLAVFKVYATAERPGSDDWIGRHATRAYKLVLGQLVDDEAWTECGLPYSLDRVVDVWRQLRKQPKLRRTCEVAMVFGRSCFYANRGLGNCSPDVDLDRILPGSRDGQYEFRNCIIACSRHNRSRGDMSIEQYLRSGFAVDQSELRESITFGPAT